MLLQAVQCQLRFIINEDLQRLQRVSENTEGKCVPRTFAMNFLHVTLISFDSVALNIITCLW